MNKKYLQSLSFVALITTSAMTLVTTPFLSSQAYAAEPAAADGVKPVDPVSAKSPMRVAFYNASDEDAKSAYDTISDQFSGLKDVTQLDKDLVTQTATAYGLNNSDFTNDGARTKRASDIHKFMSDLQADLLIVLDVSKKGKKLEMIAIDTDGKAVNTEKKNVRKGKINKKDAKKILSSSVDEARPSVATFRKGGGWTKPAPVAAVEPPESTADAASSDSVAASASSPAAAPLTPQASKEDQPNARKSAFLVPTSKFAVSLLGTFGISSIKFKDQANNKVDFDAKYPGGALAIQSTFITFGKRVGLGATIFGGYSPYKTELINGTQKTKLKSSLMFAQLQLDIPIAVNSHFMLSPYVGGDFRKAEIKDPSNAVDYTGEQLIGARAGLNLNIVAGGFHADLGGGVVPTFKNTISSNYYGAPKSKLLLTYEGRAMITFEFIHHLAIVAGYDFRLTQTPMSKTGRVFTTEAPKLTEMSHFAFGGLQYRL